MTDIDFQAVVKKMYSSLDKKSYYQITPQIVKSHAEQVLTIRPNFAHYRLEGPYTVVIWPLYHFPIHPDPEVPLGSQPFEVTAVNNALCFSYTFAEEQEYLLRVSQVEEGQETLFFTSSVYALDEDLYIKKPFKGDLHLHTIYSDGFEPPELIIASARKCGFDFIGIADHNNYAGSVHTERIAKKIQANLVVIRGEEFSCAFAPIHILSLGAPKAVEKKYYQAHIQHSPAVLALAKQAEVEGVDVLVYACVQNLLQEIRKIGGFSVICHPFWKYLKPSGARNDTPINLYEALIANRCFDGMEIISGSSESPLCMLQNTYIKSKFLDLQGLPVIGISDSHTTLPPDTLFGSHYTIIFADELEADNLMENLRHQRSVAVEKISPTASNVHGNFRLSQYALFLIKEYFPLRDRQAYLEGEQLFFALYQK